MVLLAEKRPPGRDHRLIDVRAGTEPRLGEKIAGQMFDQKLIVRDALVERTDEVVAVVPGVGDDVVALVPARLGVAHQVHPVPRPTFAEMRRGQQPVYDAFAGAGSGVREKRLNVVATRRQSSDDEVNAAQPRALIGGWRGRQLRLLQSVQDETILRRERPARVLHRRDFLPVGRFPQPCLLLFALLEVEVFAGHCGRLARHGKCHGRKRERQCCY